MKQTVLSNNILVGFKTTIIALILISFIAACSYEKVEKTENLNSDSIELEKYDLYCNKITYENYKQYNLNVIADYETDRDTAIIIDFLNKNISKIFQYDDYPFEQPDLVKYTHLIDINADGEGDIIYQGPSGGEPNMTVIFINQENSFSEIFRQYQDIFEMEFKDNRLSKLSITNPGCCADPQVVDYFYEVSFNDNNPQFKLFRTTGYLSGYEKPEDKLSRERKITITQEKAKLRNECYELDTEHPFYGETGNALTTYQKGSTGTALAEKRISGIVWLYVLMDEKSSFDNNNFPTFKEQPIELFGWIKKDETDMLE